MRSARRITRILAIAGVVLLTSGCQKQKALPDLSNLGAITAFSREEGSGTRAEFETLLHLQKSEAAQVVSSTEEMIEMVASSKGAIGYTAFSSLLGANAIKALEVDGITPTSETIKNGKYPLCREYFLAYTGELSEVETDFLAYIKTAGQEVVGQFCIPESKADTFLSDQSEGSISIHGSSSAAPILTALAKDYQTYNPNVQITIETTDSSSGLNDALEGKCDLAMSSRSLKDYEKELLQTQVIGKDAIAVIVASDHPLQNLSMKQIGKIYENTYENWSDIK